MSRVKIYNSSIPREVIAKERQLAYLRLSPKAKIEQLFNLIELSIALNGGKPIKSPQGKGLIISRKK